MHHYQKEDNIQYFTSEATGVQKTSLVWLDIEKSPLRKREPNPVPVPPKLEALTTRPTRGLAASCNYGL